MKVTNPVVSWDSWKNIGMEIKIKYKMNLKSKYSTNSGVRFY